MFYSVLFPNEASARLPRSTKAPDCFKDMNLDQITRRVLQEKQAFQLEEFFYTPLSDMEVIRYRQEVMQELENPMTRMAFQGVIGQIGFMNGMMDGMRMQLMTGDKLTGSYLDMGHFLETITIYMQAVTNLEGQLRNMPLKSEGLRNFSKYLTEYCSSESTKKMIERHAKLKEQLSKVRYCMVVNKTAGSIRVQPYEGQDDYAIRISDLFVRFRQGDVRDYRWHTDDTPISLKLENEVLKMVASIYSAEFKELTNFVKEYIHFDDETILKFVREIQFYLGWLDMTDTLRQKGLPFCYPKLHEKADSLAAYGCFDLALALRTDKAVVTNDFTLTAPEQIIVVSGPNQNGKSTFSRSFGQLHYLSTLGVCVPGSEADVFLCDKVLTHFEKEEDLANLTSKLEDELIRLKAMMDQATPRTVLIINEIFASTTLQDALLLGRKMIDGIIQKCGPSLMVTFMEELSEYGPQTVSMVTSVSEDEKHQRTFKIVRRKADGLAFALQIASRHGVTYEQLKRRLQA